MNDDAAPPLKPPSDRARSVTVDGNALTLLTGGRERFEALLSLIDGAKRDLRLLYYTFLDDESGEAVVAALLRAIERGVRVSLLVDGFGSSKTPDDYFTRLGDAGATFCRFLPSLGRRYLIRNHQKLALADEAVALIGGFNIADDYFQEAEEGGWRDLGLIVDGPAAGRLAPYFDDLMGWALRKGARIRDLRRIIHKFSENEGVLQWSYGGPMRRLSPWANATCRDLASSNDVQMIAAYFAPTYGMLRRIARIGGRGRARVITAAKSDNTATIAAARFTYGRLLKRGVEIYEYRPTKLHTKLVVLDDVVHIGSSNFDIRSLYLNLEMMLRVDDPEFATMMRHYFEGEVQDSLRITPDLHRKRGTLASRIKWAASFFLVTTGDYTVTRRLNFGSG
ncbi:phosphatidylserine/phosphatidylglycerophosphate/cardiolipin synthase family protein [Sphingomonas rhizophila]|uniref:Phospholipase D n=1 Tax=Sphingomonas rhizophila TaxID=2071607 RepID=A0A7G9SA69_9SPHN|nr:phosphatidylserine/phosphatidylglycerophosphate/cardiolipin synthase family protein [Sphingomonas rhizophila]QNN64744.1 phosphatidylserine/phosphatidylglycerophosphate/cardiolipin synthase family protein [Sphingomonas rhizophila]